MDIKHLQFSFRMYWANMKGLLNMVLELRGRLWIHRSRRVRTSQRRSVMALPKAAFVKKR